MFKLLFLTTLLTVIIGCGGSDNKKAPPTPKPENNHTNSNTNTTINDFSVIGTSVTKNGAVPINSNLKSGAFKFSWQVTSSDPYEVDVYLSSDSFLVDKKDIHIFGQKCGSSGSSYQCDTKGSSVCNFSNENKVTCVLLPSSKEVSDISSLLNSLPQTAYLIIEACNNSYKSCKVATQKIEFQ